MACFHPIRAWRTSAGAVVLGRERQEQNGEGATHLRLPCGGCLGCRQDRAREWALRCHLENNQHRHAVFTTLTYDDAHLPEFNSLERSHLQLWLKRLRKRAVREAPGAARSIRFFACGEYGETNHRPHYHALVFGLSERHKDLIEDTWGKGFTQVGPVTPAGISYVAGYTAKKIGWKFDARTITDPDTGEVLYHWEPPFIQMSRRPGIGADAKQWAQSWRLHAIHNGHRMPVPRYLHKAWEETATPLEIEELKQEKAALSALRDTSKERRQAAERIAIARQRMQGAKRSI